MRPVLQLTPTAARRGGVQALLQRPGSIPPSLWVVVAVVAGLIGLVALVVADRYTARVRLAPGRSAPATAVLGALAFAVMAAAIIGRSREALGLVLMGLALLALAASWLALAEHRFAGPVVTTFGPGRGMHTGDLLVVVPLVLAALSIARAVVLRGSA